jgi:hypothetical protein
MPSTVPKFADSGANNGGPTKTIALIKGSLAPSMPSLKQKVAAALTERETSEEWRDRSKENATQDAPRRKRKGAAKITTRHYREERAGA